MTLQEKLLLLLEAYKHDALRLDDDDEIAGLACDLGFDLERLETLWEGEIRPIAPIQINDCDLNPSCPCHNLLR